MELPDSLTKAKDQAFASFLAEQQKLEDAATTQVAPEPAEISEAPESLKENDNFAQRARQTVQTLSDKNGRQIVAEIINVQAGSLKVRRQNDQHILQLPHSLLCAEDLAFAAYLWEQQILKESNAAQLKLNSIEADTTDSVSQAPQAPTPQKHDGFAQRALKTVQSLSDKTGRKLVAEIIEVKADSLEIRRQSDHRIIQLPHSMLCAEDQAFAAYLWEQQILESSTKALKEAEALAEAEALVEAEAKAKAKAEALEAVNTAEAPASSAADMIWNKMFQ